MIDTIAIAVATSVVVELGITSDLVRSTLDELEMNCVEITPFTMCVFYSFRLH